MTNALVDTASIPGWGVDANPENDPTYPMRHVAKQTRGLTWERPALQQPDVEILRSVEHNRLPAVVGTSTPPAGLSGMIRRYAFRRSESDWWHWLLLMAADRLNVVEGVLEDVARGKIPNIAAELGWRSELRHHPMGLVKKAGVAAAIGAGLFAWSRRSRRPKTKAKAGNGASHFGDEARQRAR